MYQSLSTFVPPTMTYYTIESQTTNNLTETNITHISTSSRNDVRPRPLFRMTNGTSEVDPRRSQNDYLPSDGIYIFILHTSETSRTQSGTKKQCVHRLMKERRREDEGPSFNDLTNVLNRPADELTTTRSKPVEEIFQVCGRVNCYCCERDSCLSGWN